MIYLDNNATTPLDNQVLEAMMQDFDGLARNPSSVTKLGRQAKLMLFNARASCAKNLSCKSQEIIFTSGATESNNLAIHALAERYKGVIVTSKIEHPSILEPISALEKCSRRVHYLEVDAKGHVDPNEILNIQEPIAFVALSAANSETGVMNPIHEISALLDTLSIPFLIDAVGQFARAPLDIQSLTFHALTLSGHKIHGPKGSGLLILKRQNHTPLFYGGSQEHGMRAGTENLSAILGLTKAIELFKENETKQLEHMQKLRTLFESGLKKIDPTVEFNGSGPKVTNTTNAYFPNQDGQTLLINLDQNNCIASMGSACAAASLEPSRVLQQMYPKSYMRANSSLRFSICQKNTKQEIEKTLKILKHLTASSKKCVSLS